MPMQARFLKRLRLEIDLRHAQLPQPQLPAGYTLRPWNSRLLLAHAEVKAESFADELDSRLFLALSSAAGCEDLMRTIALHPGFLPEATWLVEFVGNDFRDPVPCGTIQGLAISTRRGSIQNLGVSPEHRGTGIGRALVIQALAGYAAKGLHRVSLEVTAVNHPAVELYRSLGFRHLSSSYLQLPEPVELT